MITNRAYTVQNFRRGLGAFVMIGVFLACLGILIAVSVALKPSILGFLGYMVACFVLGRYLFKATIGLSVSKLTLVLTDEDLTIHSSKSAERVIKLQHVVSYQCYEYNEATIFNLRLQSGRALTLVHNSLFCPKDDFQTFAADFESQRISASGNTQNHVIQHEKGFFEKPFANVLGWGFVAALVLFTVYLLMHGIKAGKADDVLMLYSSSLLFLGPWLSARRKKAQA